MKPKIDKWTYRPFDLDGKALPKPDRRTKLDAARVDASRLLSEALSRICTYTEWGQPYYPDGVFWRLGHALVQHLKNEGHNATNGRSTAAAASDCLEYLELYAETNLAERPFILKRLGLLTLKLAGEPAAPWQSTAPLTPTVPLDIDDSLMSKIDDALLPLTQEMLVGGNAVNTFKIDEDAKVQRRSKAAIQPGQKLLSIPEVSDFLGVHRGTVYRLIKAGSLPIVKIAGRTLVRPDELEKLIEDSVKP